MVLCVPAIFWDYAEFWSELLLSTYRACTCYVHGTHLPNIDLIPYVVTYLLVIEYVTGTNLDLHGM